jgi:anaerobic selenocysteine-containing dehydrogenase
MAATATRTTVRTCPLCEAMCGLELTLDGDEVVAVRGDADDVLSRGFLCPKGASIGGLQGDPDRLRAPLLKGADGVHREASWEEAFARVEEGLGAVLAEHGRDAVALYRGNPSAHAYGALLYGQVLAKALATRNLFSASTVDQQPKHVACAHVFGNFLTCPVPDLDRCEHLLVLGANPWASNGSLMTAPNARGRMKAMQARGGKLVVVDPRRTATAKAADEHHPIRPGTDVLLLLAMVHVLFAEDLVDLAHLEGRVAGLDALRAAAEPFPPEAVAPRCGIAAADIARLARELAAAPRAAVYGRFGTTTQRFGTATSWLVDALNVLTGNLDREGGAMFAWPATGTPAFRGARPGMPPPRAASRVRGLPQVLGELPVSCMAEELDTPGDGQVRAMITIAGNPVLTTPNGRRLDAALAGLEFMVSVDLYLNETTRHADVVLPAPGPLEKGHYEMVLHAFAVRDTTNWSPPTLPRPDGMPDEWETILRLAAIAAGLGTEADLEAFDRQVAVVAAARDARRLGLDPEAIVDALAPRTGAERLLDLQLRTGPYGTGFPSLGAPGPGELCLDHLEAHPHGVDLGPLRPRLDEALNTASGLVELAPEALLPEVERARALLDEPGEGLLLIGRRDLRSNNSWMHNVPKLVSGPQRCTALVHPEDAARLGLADGAPARLRSRVGEVVLPVTVTDDVMPGVVSVPHGWGHDAEGTRQAVARAHAGASVNDLTDELLLDPLGGTAVLCGVPIEVEVL